MNRKNFLRNTELQNNFNLKNYLATITLLIITISLNSFEVYAPPTPHSVNGYVFYANGSQVPLGTKYTLNISASGYFKQSQTSFPVPGSSGFYSESVSGTDGDQLVLTSWKDAFYGVTNVSLLGTMRGVNVTLNLSRSPEPTANITYPSNNSIRNDSSYFTVISNLTLFGNNATNCFTAISYSNSSVLTTYNNQNTTASLGNLSIGYSAFYYWNISGVGVGYSNVTVNFTCDGMFGTTFEDLTYYSTLANITVIDTTAPNITLISPLNNTKTNVALTNFQYNLTDLSNISNCSLYINNTFRQVNTTFVPRNTTLNFFDTLFLGLNTWQIRCVDVYNNQGFSRNYSITLDNNTRTVIPINLIYVQGLTSRFTGVNWTNNGIITLLLTKFDSSTYSWNITATNGNLNTTYWINYSDPLGNYTLFAYEYNYSFYNASTTFNVSLRTQGLFTNKSEYATNENVSITGFNFTINGTVRLTIFQNTSNGVAPTFPRNVTSNVSGDFIYSWNVTDTCTGVYGVRAEDLNYSPYNITTYFNISGGIPCTDFGNSVPSISNMVLDDLFSSPQNEINLLAAQQTPVFCNYTVSDDNGYLDINISNATLYYYLNSSTSQDNNNTHYTNSSCTETGNDGVNSKNFSCGFSIWYNAFNGSWVCNATAYDISGARGYNNDSARILDLFALNITSLIDFGSVATGDISAEITAPITNLGNVNLNINISAYAVTPNDGIAMNCTYANISLSDEKYSNVTSSFAAKTAVTGTMAKPAGFGIARQTNSSLSQRDTFWMVRATPSSLGVCQGVVVVTAS